METEYWFGFVFSLIGFLSICRNPVEVAGGIVGAFLRPLWAFIHLTIGIPRMGRQQDEEIAKLKANLVYLQMRIHKLETEHVKSDPGFNLGPTGYH